MAEFGGPESFAPGEGGAAAPEQLSEEARQRFAAAAAAMQTIKREEKRSKKRDARVAHTIVQFLNDERYTHLFVLISRLVARDCPSVFILAVLSLISDDCNEVVKEYLKDTGQKTEDETMKIVHGKEDGAFSNVKIVKWITRMQMVLSLETSQILTRLMVDEKNIDGTVLQLTTFVLQDFYQSESGGKRSIQFEKLHVLSSTILQTVFEPFMDKIDKKLLQQEAQDQEDD